MDCADSAVRAPGFGQHAQEIYPQGIVSGQPGAVEIRRNFESPESLAGTMQLKMGSTRALACPGGRLVRQSGNGGRQTFWCGDFRPAKVRREARRTAPGAGALPNSCCIVPANNRLKVCRQDSCPDWYW